VALGRHLFLRAFQLALLGWLGCILLQALLYLRPAPHGGPFLLESGRYFGLALYYELLGTWLLSAPFLILWLVLYRRPLTPRWTLLLRIHAGLLAINLLLSQADHEVLRFLGLRLTPSFLATYGEPATLADRLFLDLLLADRGGPLLSLALLAVVPAIYLWISLRTIRRPVRRTFPAWFAALLALVPLAAPGNAWLQATSQFRLRKVEPVIVAMVIDVREGFADFARPADFAAAAAEHQRAWLARSADPDWRFPDPERPYLRVPTRRGRTPERWNVIYLQLETLRGADTGFLLPDRGPSATPNLDALARSPGAAAWRRASSFGMPSINGLFATHCSVAPHSRRFVTSFSHAGLLCLPELLRRRGWRAEMFNGGDTDWDNSSPWITRWYDRLWRFPEARQRDREMFRAAAGRIRALGRSRTPFWATLVSVTNHTPFTSPEPRFGAGGGTVGERIRGTTRYTDDVVGEFLRSIAGEPWFERTILVVAGDHGFNAGEHGATAGQHNLYRESLWVPLIIAGRHPRLAAGMRDEQASLLDVAPTIADLLGMREANPWQGHSLLAVNGDGRLAFGFGGSLLNQSRGWTAIRHRDGRQSLYADWLQRRDLAASRPALARAMIGEAERAQRLHDHLLRNDLVWR
jgi:hypothetical protein